MIDLDKAKKYFKEYIADYNSNSSKIKLKVIHTYYVAENCKIISQNLGLSQEEQNLAELIGLLHDIGRFEQVKVYNTFSDKDSVDHAKKGIEVLFKDRYIRKFVDIEKYDDIIYKAIENHNKFEIEEGLSDQKLLFCKIIRDADKIDIFRAFVDEEFEDIVQKGENEISNQILTLEVLEEFKKEHLIDYKYCKTGVDYIVAIFAFIYDINCTQGLYIIKRKDYIAKIINKMNCEDELTRKRLNDINMYAINYIDSKIK